MKRRTSITKMTRALPFRVYLQLKAPFAAELSLNDVQRMSEQLREGVEVKKGSLS